MKRSLIVLMLLAVSFGYSQRKPKIKGNKEVVDVREELPPYTALELNDDLDINLRKSTAVGYNITADDNLIDVLKFEVVDSTLVISSFYKITSKKKLEITVNYNELRTITMRDGRIRMKDMINTDYLAVNTFGSSKLELNANASVMDVQMEGNSSGDFNLDTDSLNLVLKDRIDVRIYSVSETSNIEMHKNAGARIEGTTDTLRVNLLENANLKAQKLESGTALVNLEETPSARIYAYKEFELTSRGSSKVYLYGNPKITIHEFLDTSELFKRNN